MEESKELQKIDLDYELPAEESAAAKNKREVGSPAWRAGQSGNPNGRPKGARNKLSGEIKATLQKIGIKRIGKLDEDLDAMPPYQRWIIITKLMPYITTPESDKVQIGTTMLQNFQVQVVYKDTQKTFDIKHQEEE